MYLVLEVQSNGVILVVTPLSQLEDEKLTNDARLDGCVGWDFADQNLSRLQFKFLAPNDIIVCTRAISGQVRQQMVFSMVV